MPIDLDGYAVARAMVCDALHTMGERGDVFRGTHGNVSMLCGDAVVIKPSGVSFRSVRDDEVSVVVSASNERLCGLVPSVDTRHHTAIYERHPWVVAICHSHTRFAVAHAVAQRQVSCMCTEHADVFGHPVRVLPYARFDAWGGAVRLEEHESAVLLARHGAIAVSRVGPSHAVALALALEDVAEKNAIAYGLAAGYIDPLDPGERDAWRRRYCESYGQR